MTTGILERPSDAEDDDDDREDALDASATDEEEDDEDEESEEDLENAEEAVCNSCKVLYDTDFMTWEKFENGDEDWVCDHCTGKSEPDPA